MTARSLALWLLGGRSRLRPSAVLPLCYFRKRKVKDGQLIKDGQLK
jgi:hypothetical protein